ncbi:MAG: hypothetical protein JWO59_3468, partial [Chloroflexi bacterium]|nr:hypothetical protein [Chloroflexota bacterium]
HLPVRLRLRVPLSGAIMGEDSSVRGMGMQKPRCCVVR